MEELKLDRTFYTKRPKEKRLPKEERVYDLLERLEIPFIRVDHSAIATIEECFEVEKLLEIAICKNLFLHNSNKSNYYLLMMLGQKKFNTKEVSKQLNETRLSFADAEDMEKFLDITPGSVSVLGLMNDKENRVQLLIDEELLQEEYTGCHPCINTSSLKLKTADVLEKILPAIDHKPIQIKLGENHV